MTRFAIGDRVRFTCRRDLVEGEVEEIRRGHEGNHLLVVRQGAMWSGQRFIVLSSYAESVGVAATA